MEIKSKDDGRLGPISRRGRGLRDGGVALGLVQDAALADEDYDDFDELEPVAAPRQNERGEDTSSPRPRSEPGIVVGPMRRERPGRGFS